MAECKLQILAPLAREAGLCQQAAFVAAHPHPALIFEADPRVDDVTTQTRELDEPVHLLVVDDVAENRELVVRTFSGAMSVTEAASGADGLAALERVKPNVVIADQRMAGMTGVEMLAKIAEIDPACIRVLMTAYLDYDALVHAINVGRVHHYVEKPIRPKELRAAVVSLVHRERRAQPVMDPMSLWVAFLHKEAKYTFVEDQFGVGRAAGNDLVLRDRSVSGKHLHLSITDAGVWVSDLGSRNGTLINDRVLHPHRPARLQDGDRVAIGAVACTFREPLGMYRFLRSARLLT